MSKQVIQTNTIRARILDAVAKICDPVRQTLTPKGGNVLFTEHGVERFSNDGVTIANSISSSDNIENAIINIIKQAAMATNNSVGDGTTTTLIFTQALIREGFKLLDDGWNPMKVKRQLELATPLILDEMDKLKHKVANNKDLEYVARVSSNDDAVIAKNVLDAVKTAGTDGLKIGRAHV